MITHFNRPAQVLPVIARIRRDLLDDPSLCGAISLTVVDNSRKLPLERIPASPAPKTATSGAPAASSAA